MDKPRAAATRCCMCHFKRNSSIALREKEREREKERRDPNINTCDVLSHATCVIGQRPPYRMEAHSPR